MPTNAVDSSHLIGEHLPLAFEFQDSRSELIITAAD